MFHFARIYARIRSTHVFASATSNAFSPKKLRHHYLPIRMFFLENLQTRISIRIDTHSLSMIQSRPYLHPCYMEQRHIGSKKNAPHRPTPQRNATHGESDARVPSSLLMGRFIMSKSGPTRGRGSSRTSVFCVLRSVVVRKGVCAASSTTKCVGAQLCPSASFSSL